MSPGFYDTDLASLHNCGAEWIVLVEGNVEGRILTRKIAAIRCAGTEE
jgi:hypothetical protein